MSIGLCPPYFVSRYSVVDFNQCCPDQKKTQLPSEILHSGPLVEVKLSVYAKVATKATKLLTIKTLPL